MLEWALFLNCTWVGIITGLAGDITVGIKKLFKNNIFINNAIDFCIYILGGLFVFYYALKLNNGIVAVYEWLGFLIGLVLEKITCKNLFAKSFDMLYNGNMKLAGTIKKTRLGLKLFK